MKQRREGCSYPEQMTVGPNVSYYVPAGTYLRLIVTSSNEAREMWQGLDLLLIAHQTLTTWPPEPSNVYEPRPR